MSEVEQLWDEYDEDFDELDFLSDHIHDIKKQLVMKMQATFALPEVLKELDNYFEDLKRHKDEEEAARKRADAEQYRLNAIQEAEYEERMRKLYPGWKPRPPVKMHTQTLRRFRNFADPETAEETMEFDKVEGE